MTPRLRSLELHGYKTFASRTLLEFSGNITAIVGPNGSGKSNVADAIRWVLGEQSYTLLRGRRTEDMIFAGSEYRPRASMASASILLDNSDGWLPIDFSEVGITRRAYRDGDNEYLLNGTRVRLKDTSELLAQSGLAERTYTIIGQGLVDVALSLKPEERRRFFEEAAGIGLYRSRREETLTRLEHTTRNLERVLDIMSELEPRLASLEKQARRVVEYEQVKADLKLLLRDWYGYHWHKSQRDLTYALDVLRQQDEKTESARDRFHRAEMAVVEYRGRLQVQREALNGWHSQAAEQHTQLEQVSRSLAVLEERQRSLTSLSLTLQQDLDRLKSDSVRLEELTGELEEERDRLASEAADAESQLKSAQADLAERQQLRTALESQIRAHRQKQVAIGTETVQKQARLDELTNRQEEQTTSLGSLSTSLEADRAQLSSDETEYQQLSQNLSEQERSAAQSEDRVTTLEQELHNQERKITALKEDHRTKETERSRSVAQLEVLEQAEQALQGMTKGSQTIIQASRSGKLKGRFQALVELLEVPMEYESAFAAALGDLVDAVLVDMEVDWDAVFQVLSDDSSARTVILSEGRSKPSKPAQKQLPGAMRLLDVIQMPVKGGEVLQSLIDNVFVVGTRTEALQLSKAMDFGTRIVTLGGDIFWGSGLIVLGKEKRAGIVSRTRQIKELREQTVALTTEVSQLEQTVSTGQQEIEQLRSDLTLAKETARAARRSLDEKKQSVSQSALRVEKLRQSVQWKSSQIEQIRQQMQASGEEITRLKEQLGALEQSASSVNEALREANRELQALPMEEYQTQVSHWTTSQAVSIRAMRDAERRLQEHQGRVQGNLVLQAESREKQSSTKSALAALEEERKTLHQQEHHLSETLRLLQEKIDPAETQLAELERSYASSQDTFSQAQQGLATAERFSGQAQQDVSRLRERLETLQDKITEDFGLVAMEATTIQATAAPLPLEGVEQLPTLMELPPQLEESISRQRTQLRRLGPINPDAHREYVEVKERFDFLTTQVADLRKASADMKEVVAELDTLMQQEFRKTFHAVAEEFHQMFTRLFGGGSARLVLQDEDNPIEAGIDIEARLPGRREQGLSLLSGGERSLTAVALIFSLLKVSPTPFCVLDEVDAALDEANVGRFTELLKELAVNTQFIVITHNRNTVQAADVIYGVTMSRDSASQVISLRLDEISDEMVR
jgi:chromosome segregation protein